MSHRKNHGEKLERAELSQPQVDAACAAAPKAHITVSCPETAPRIRPQLWLPRSAKAENASRGQRCQGTAESPRACCVPDDCRCQAGEVVASSQPLHLPSPHVPNHGPMGSVERAPLSALTLS